MVVSHAVHRAIVLRSTRAALGLAACLWLVAAAALAETAGSAVSWAGRVTDDCRTPVAPKSVSTTELVFRADAAAAAPRSPAALQPACDRLDGPAYPQAASEAQYIAPGEPPELPLLPGGEQRPGAICDAAREKPPGQLTIDIQTPAGELPRDHAAECWPQIAGPTGTSPLVRCWPKQCYQWQATCFACQPLYFEETNLERHGYGLGDLCQPFVSGAHFFGTVPCLPYLMAVNPPGECIYTLGHYRPGNCPPWQHHWPPASAGGALSEAGVVTGLIFLIP